MDKYSFDRFIKRKDQNKSKKVIRFIASFFILSLVSYVFIQFGFFKENNTAYYIFIGILATAVAYFNGYFKAPKEDVDGIIDGKITFTTDSIIIGDDKYLINDIVSITIQNDDYKGKKVLEHGEFEKENGSQGVDNKLILDLGTRNLIEANFKQKSEKEFEKLKALLINYHLKNKLTFDDLVYIMKVKYDIDKIELKKRIAKKS